ncbi:MAG TPA: hypothetical protein VFQ54_04600 [Thermomicrobiales bacterium]|nr:hypothetical protein [Thermomicrobiales bacterium]
MDGRAVGTRGHPTRFTRQVGIWAWKDEDEFGEALTFGRLSPEQEAQVRGEVQRMIPAIESRAWPFDGSFENWRPDPAWPVPVMPDNWNEDE